MKTRKTFRSFVPSLIISHIRIFFHIYIYIYIFLFFVSTAREMHSINFFRSIKIERNFKDDETEKVRERKIRSVSRRNPKIWRVRIATRPCVLEVKFE